MLDRNFRTVKCKDLIVDYTYQRPIEKAKVNKIVKNFDPAQVRPFYVSRRPNGKLYIIDGQHTNAALLQRDAKAVNDAYVYEGLTLEEEADLFYKLNTNAKRLTANQNIKARYVAKDSEVTYYVKLLDQSGIRWAWKSGGKSAVFDSHTRGLGVLKDYGKDVFLKTLDIMRLLTESRMFTGEIFEALAYIVSKCGNSLNVALMARKLNETPYFETKRTVSGLGALSHGKAKKDAIICAKVLVGIYNKNLRSNRISIEGGES